MPLKRTAIANPRVATGTIRTMHHARLIPRTIRLLCAALLALSTFSASAHPGDFVNQVWLEIEITDQHVQQRVMIPLAQALEEVFGGITLDEFRQREPQAVHLALTAYHIEMNPLTINGLPVQPILGEHEITVPATTTPRAAIDPEQYEKHAVLGYVAEYPTLGEPNRVGLVWGVYAYDDLATFNPPLGQAEQAPLRERVPLVAEVTAFGKTKLQVLSEEEPGYTWHNDLAGPPTATSASQGIADQPAHAAEPTRIPAVSLGFILVGGVLTLWVGLKKSFKWVPGGVLVTLLAAAICFPFGWVTVAENAPPPIAELDDEQAVAVFTELHRNIYRAFDYNTDSAIYDALAQSVEGPELDVIFNDVYASLILQEEGGAVSKVQEVDILEARVIDLPPTEGKADAARDLGTDAAGPPPFAVRCAWTVRGLVSHFGHTHERLNSFEATYTLAPRHGEWRIIDTELHRQERLDDPAEDREPAPNLDNLLGTDDE